jgi:hypothetical protein
MTPNPWLAPCWTPERVEAFRPVILAQPKGRDAINAAWQAVPAEHRDWAAITLAEGRLPTLAAPAFVVPVLSPQACTAIVEKSRDWQFEVNEAERPAYQMDEAVIGYHDPEFDRFIKGNLADALAPWIMAIWGRLPSRWVSLQLASYSPTSTAESGYHIDDDSDVTAVLALNDDFAGGGLAIRDGLLGECTLPPLPKGYAVLFDGRRTIHRGLPVSEGRRVIMTAWSNSDGDRW